ncbi:hypothetical protein F5Y18DRAFT_430874 [Xylariaceae sp. FL1019]|nr:hypothetical protein F5Y18DRAFT_430874 [Xylariaceae sp. FL1019]
MPGVDFPVDEKGCTVKCTGQAANQFVESVVVSIAVETIHDLVTKKSLVDTTSFISSKTSTTSTSTTSTMGDFTTLVRSVVSGLSSAADAASPAAAILSDAFSGVPSAGAFLTPAMSRALVAGVILLVGTFATFVPPGATVSSSSPSRRF